MTTQASDVLTEAEVDEIERRTWFRRVGRAMATQWGEPVLRFGSPPGRLASENSGPRGSLPYLVLLSQADRIERNAEHEVLGSPAGDTIVD